MSGKNGQFTQISLFSVLLGGHYGGIVSVGEVKRLGNLAIEMIWNVYFVDAHH